MEYPKSKVKHKNRKAKGRQGEKEVERILNSIGGHAIRVPLSGALQGLPACDVLWKLSGETYQVECKWRGDGFRELYRWRGTGQIVALRADRQPWLFVMTADQLADIAFRIADAVEKGGDKIELL